jgi:hypothetical protein
MRRKVLFVATLFVVTFTAGLTQAYAAITPASFEATLKPGESAHVTKVVDVPEVPRLLDVMLMVDLTGSYSDDLPQIRSLAPSIFDNVRAIASRANFGLSTFVDLPFDPWGVSGEWGYRLDQPLTEDRGTWLTAVNSMVSRFGNDTPESQYIALYQAVTGAGLEMPTTTDGDYADPGEIPPGQQIDWRRTSNRVIAITTDSSFHNAGDSGSFPYPAPTRDQLVAALRASRVRIISIKAPGASSQMDDIAAATGGSVVSTSSTSAEIASAITAGLEDLRFVVRPSPEGCEPLELTFDPDQIRDVPGGTMVSFNETITVPPNITRADLPTDGVVRCAVRFRATLSAIGIQSLTVTVILNQAPDCATVKPDITSLEPSNHKFRLVRLTGATDPDGDPVTLVVKGVTQDEPVNGTGDGDTSPDAQAGPTSDSVNLRAERAGNGDGRVYRISFEGSDGNGGTCAGAVNVTVPRSQGNQRVAVDSGQNYPSFGP